MWSNVLDTCETWQVVSQVSVFGFLHIGLTLTHYTDSRPGSKTVSQSHMQSDAEAKTEAKAEVIGPLSKFSHWNMISLAC